MTVETKMTYVADDGTRFHNLNDCQVYEVKCLLLKEKIHKKNKKTAPTVNDIAKAIKSFLKDYDMFLNVDSCGEYIVVENINGSTVNTSDKGIL